jgi:hypothetical protein
VLPSPEASIPTVLWRAYYLSKCPHWGARSATLPRDRRFPRGGRIVNPNSDTVEYTYRTPTRTVPYE